MDVLLTHKQVVEDYACYIQSFLNIADPAIRSTVENKLAEAVCGRSRFCSSTPPMNRLARLKRWLPWV